MFLQKSYSDTRPDLGYLVFMDKIYLLAYPLVLLVLVLVRTILGYLQLERQGQATLAVVRRDDRILLVVLGAMVLIGTWLITLLR
jgi:hypothetical protein